MAPRRRSSGPRRGASRTPRKVGPKTYPARSSSAREAKRDVQLVRLNKYLADQGVASRRACDELIAKGKVSVDGETLTIMEQKQDFGVYRTCAKIIDIDRLEKIAHHGLRMLKHLHRSNNVPAYYATMPT